jgi:hypothetical protein
VYGVIWVGLLASLVALTFASTLVAAQQPEKPNVVFFLADNVGYGDLGPYGGGELRGAPTPRIDQLARDGLRLGNQGLSEECVGFAEFRAPLGEARPQRPRADRSAVGAAPRSWIPPKGRPLTIRWSRARDPPARPRPR